MSDGPPPALAATPEKKDLTPKERAAARQAKLLANSASRLSKITAGAEGRVISDAAVGIQPRPASSAPLSPPVPTSLNDDADPAEIDLSALPGAAGGGPSGGAPGNALNPFDFASILNGAGGPPGMGSAGGADPFAQLMAQFGGAGGPGAGGPFGGSPGAMGPGGLPTAPISPIPPTPKSALDKFFPWLHLFSMVGLAVYAVGWVETGLHGRAWKEVTGGGIGLAREVDWTAWALLGEGKSSNPVAAVMREGIKPVPLVWLFVTVELILQSTRLFLLRNRPTPPSLLNSVLPIVQSFSPQLALLISTGQKYIQLLAILLNDFAVLVFTIGCIIIFARWKIGARGHGWHGVHIQGMEGSDWIHSKSEL